jgi:omega-6 fatty acid desaturase (delta-12 desaturase)
LQSAPDLLKYLGELNIFTYDHQVSEKQINVSTATIPQQAAPKKNPLPWQQAVAPYQHADLRISLWQMLNSIGSFFILWYLAYRSLEVSYLLTLPLCILAGLFAMRIFIIFHDCGHGSFFKSQKANHLVGVITGIITFTPYWAWRHSHAVHHATAGDLDRRGVGDVWTLTYDEYQKLPKVQKLIYRIYRNPFVIFGIGPFIDFVVLQRFTAFNAADKPRERSSVIFTNLALLGIFLGMGFTIGFDKYLLVQMPIIAFASSFGVYLFYMQHQYENVYWERHQNWDFVQAALQGSSYFKMPKILQWFTGNIGYHHIHHLSPRIPNYKLEACHNANEMFQIEPMTFLSSLKSMKIRLFDEDRHRMIGYHKPDDDDLALIDPDAKLQAQPAPSGD